MDTFYTAYTKLIQGKTFYFVKKFSTFPEYKNVPDVLANYGMHVDFNRACNIAEVNDPSIIQELFKDIDVEGRHHAKVIHMNSQNVIKAAQ